MTAAPHSMLVEKVAERMHTAGHEAGFFYFPWEKVAEHGREKYAVLAKAAIAACHAEEMQATLQLFLAAIGRLPVRIITGELQQAILTADAILKALEGRK